MATMRVVQVPRPNGPFEIVQRSLVFARLKMNLKWPPLSRPFFGLNKLMSGGVVAS